MLLHNIKMHIFRVFSNKPGELQILHEGCRYLLLFLNIDTLNLVQL